MLTIILCWVVLFVAIYLLGRLFWKGIFEWYEYFWFGLVIVIAILQIWSIFLPVNIYSLLFVFLLSGVSLLTVLKKKISLPKLDLKFLIFSSIILLVLSYFASLHVYWYDTNLYHLNAVKWANLYPVVPGLANLHDRFGTGSSLFLFASMIDNWFLKDRSSHVALSLLAAVLSIQLLWIFMKSKERLIKIFSLLVLPLPAFGIMKEVWTASLSPDFALIIIGLVIGLEILKGKKESLFLAGLLSLVLITLKFSGVFFAGLVILYSAYKIRSFASFALFGGLLLIPLLIRNVILSGWPFYPLAAFGLNVPWSVPKKDVIDTYLTIKTWAISPGPGWNKSSDLNFFRWFPDWYARNNGAVELKMFLIGIYLALIAPLVKIMNKDFVKKYQNLLFLGLASFLSIFYILFTAPSLRFGQVFIWLFFASVTSCFVDIILIKRPKLKILFIALGIYFIFKLIWPVRTGGVPILKSMRWEQSLPVEQVLIIPKDRSPSFKVYKPTYLDLCGNSNLPCTPYPNNNIKEIIPGDLSKGFAPVK